MPREYVRSRSIKYDWRLNQCYQGKIMSRINVVSILAALSVLLLTFSLPAQQSAESAQGNPTDTQLVSPAPAKKKIVESVAELEENSRQSYADGKYVRFYVANMKLHELRPYEPRYLENIIAACALVDRKRTTLRRCYDRLSNAKGSLDTSKATPKDGSGNEGSRHPLSAAPAGRSRGAHYGDQ